MGQSASPGSELARGWSAQQLIEFLAAVSSSPDSQSAVRRAVERATEAFEAEMGAFIAADEVVISVGFPEGQVPEAELVGLVGHDHAAGDLPGLGACRVAGAPLDDEPGGWLVLARMGDDPFGREDVHLLRGMGRVLSMTLQGLRLLEGERALRARSEGQAAENARLLGSLERQRRLHEQLSRIEKTIAHRARLQEVLDAIVEGAAALLEEEIAVLRMVDANDPSWMLMVASRGTGWTRTAAQRSPVTHGVAGRAMAEAGAVVVDPDDHPSHTLQDPGIDGARALIAVPVHEHGTVVGSLLVASRSLARHFGRADREMLLAFAEHASLALAAAKTVDTMRQAFNDPLTGLANRALFLNRLDHALHRASRSGAPATALFLDVDRFKLINDSLGHAAGDELLVAVAERLRSCLRSAETAARLGGDEFAVLLEDEAGAQAGVRAAQRIIDALRKPIELHGNHVFVSTSIGIASAQSGRPEDLLRDADVAMYRAKAQKRGSYEVFEPGMHAEVVARLELEADMQQALERGDFELHYQPIVDLRSERIVGAEALVRFRDPKRGLVAPNTFIPLAEETGLILPIGRFVLREACRQAAAWQAERPSGPLLKIAVNLSGRQLQQASLTAEVAEAIEWSGLAPGTLVLEITETVAMQDTEMTIARLEELRRLDVLVAIDDFGTGYSSLCYLQELPIDILKIAKPFVDGLGRIPEDGALARAIVELGHGLGLNTIAEGIEGAHQATRMREWGCALGQGFHFARPLEAEAMGRLLRASDGDEVFAGPSELAYGGRRTSPL
jgi:diguanylate cyclase (GGDEF)-like protein